MNGSIVENTDARTVIWLELKWIDKPHGIKYAIKYRYIFGEQLKTIFWLFWLIQMHRCDFHFFSLPFRLLSRWPNEQSNSEFHFIFFSWFFFSFLLSHRWNSKCRHTVRSWKSINWMRIKIGQRFEAKLLYWIGTFEHDNSDDNSSCINIQCLIESIYFKIIWTWRQ